MQRVFEHVVPGIRQRFAWKRPKRGVSRRPLFRGTVTGIFLLNPFFSGSTAMSAMLLQSPRTWAAWLDGEGQ